MINAIEHGNLGIDYQEKSRLLDDDTLEQEIERRLSLPEYAHRRVEVRIKRDPAGFEVLITDEGKGFDPDRYFSVEESRIFDSHGRGILFANSLLELQYLGAGNRVRVTAPRPR